MRRLLVVSVVVCCCGHRWGVCWVLGGAGDVVCVGFWWGLGVGVG